ncbi:Rne/Rng family ribonuclease [Kordiimonas pumila]|uniref:Ribonuclease E n=1 Tax=Kordiimonas pumila TaxID=2161677 RepID=A0ABV7D205_9PROT|nr:ribonuclease E/G [Kordiimonas pumila]
MSTRMLIDARHSEETRVTVVKGSRVEEFDYESSTRRQLKGNIYLARVTRVEPSLQAAFVEYGGNRHGFLAFSEIHPDYYQIPVEDREALIAAESEEVNAAEVDDDTSIQEDKPKPSRRRRGRRPAVAEKVADSSASISSDAEDLGEDASSEAMEETDELATEVKSGDEEDKDAAIEEVASRRRNLRVLKRRYNIQEVIKRRQVLLIQVVKEERGNKGAALTTYLSLAGRYCVLMPNSTHAGGISRKISSMADRKKLKEIISSLEVPQDMGLIVRTAGMQRTKVEIKRDYEYLLRLWNGIRDLTLQSTAPALVYEEGNLIKRTIRDLYAREVDEILVEGEEGYRAAKDFMKLLMPSHAKKVQHYKDRIPLFHRYQVESHLEAMYQPIVQLRSGGYIVINPTEALISIDVNSGRATKEHNIEETALKTNLEAAEEVARQLRLRDMAGLIVIDFIDMEDRNNNRSVERRMKDFLKADRARIQVGRISSFGLMEMSRQRLRPNLLEVAMETCHHCAGTGIVRSIESAALMALRQLEEEGIRNRSSVVRICTNPDVAVYLLNKKRAMLTNLEVQYNYVIEILSQPSLGQSDIELTREAATEPRPEVLPELAITPETIMPAVAAPVPVASASAANHASVDTVPEHHTEEASSDDQPRRKRRRRRRRRRGPEDAVTGEIRAANQPNTETSDEAPEGEAVVTPEGTSSEDETSPANRTSRRRRGSRGGRRRRERPDTDVATEAPPSDAAIAATDAVAQEATVATSTETPAIAPAPIEDAKPVRRRRRVVKTAVPEVVVSEAAPVVIETQKPEANDTAPQSAPSENTVEKAQPKRRAPRKRATPAAKVAENTVADATVDVPEAKKPVRRTRKKAEPKAAPADTSTDTVSNAETADTTAEKKPVRRKRAPAAAAAAVETSAPKKAAAKTADSNTKIVVNKVPDSEPATDSSSRRKGWWQRTFG